MKRSRQTRISHHLLLWRAIAARLRGLLPSPSSTHRKCACGGLRCEVHESTCSHAPRDGVGDKRGPLIRTAAKWLLLAAGAGLIVACAAMQHRTAKLSALLKFSHKFHAAQDIGCTDCHEGIEESTSLSKGEQIPTKATCKNCHEDQVDKKCEFCHVGPDREVKLTRSARKLNFSHAAHAKRDKQGCKGCHPAAAEAKVPGLRLVQDMAGCANRCHKKELQQQRCNMCHQDLLRQRLKPVVQVGHQGNWLKRHGKLAKDAARCATCHDQTYCGECHARTASMPLAIRFPERVGARMIHRGDWQGRHGVAAAADSTTCRKCHGSNHCRSCHQLAGKARSLTKGSGGSTASPHGPGWMSSTSSEFHGRRARRDISRCASCHDRGAASNCVGCHKVGASGGSPHPRSFKWSDKSTECRQNSMCVTCHAGGMGCK